MRRLLGVVATMFMLIGIVATPAIADFAADTKLCLSSSNTDEMIAACSRQINSGRWKGRDLANTYNNRGVGYRIKGDYDRAFADLNEAIRLDPKFQTAYRNRGVAYGFRGDYDRAIADFNEAMRLNPKTAWAYGERGAVYRLKGDFDRAITDLNEAIRLDLKSAATYTQRGIVYRLKGDYDRAIADFNEAIRLNPKMALAFGERGIVYSIKGDHDRAIADLNEAIRVNPEYVNVYKKSLVDTYTTRSKAFYSKSDYDRAFADLNEAIRLDPKRAEVYNSRGYIYLHHKGHQYYDRAISDFNEGIRLDPKYAAPYINRSLAYTWTGDYDRAIVDATEAIRLDSVDAADAYAHRAYAYKGKLDYDRAIADLNEAIRLDPKFTTPHFHRGLIYELKGDFANALAAFRSGLALAPNETEFSDAVRRLEQKLAARSEPKPTVSKPVEPPVVPGQPETRVALVIGNGSYSNFGPLANPGNDAKAIAAALNSLGFKTITPLFDLPRERLLDALKTFAREAEKADWAVIYFAGHGLELGGVNYLIPVDAKMSSDRDASFEAVELQKVLDAVGGAKKIGLIILDACRDNPFIKTMTRSMASTRSIGRGLAQVEPEGATLVAYAAKHGQVAQDGEGGKNSPFVAALIKNLEVAGVEIGLLFRKVRDDVLAMTGRRQEPFIYGSLPSEAFYFRRP
jgi:tetratricopeptide (TPR) repeat protein